MKNRLRELRKEKGLTLNELSNELLEKLNFKIGSNALGKYERGEREPKLDTWSKLADFFGVSIGYIQGTSEIKHSFYNADDPFNAWVNATAVHQDDEGNAYFGKNFRDESIAFMNDIDTKKFHALCRALNTSILFEDEEEMKENTTMISNIDDMLAINTIKDTLKEFFRLSLRAYNGDEKAKKAMDSIHKAIYNDYLGLKDDDYS